MLNLFVRRLANATLSGKTFRMVATQKCDEPFAHLTTKIENFARIGAAHQCAHFDCCLLGVGHLESANFPVPLRIVLNEPL